MLWGRDGRGELAAWGMLARGARWRVDMLGRLCGEGINTAAIHNDINVDRRRLVLSGPDTRLDATGLSQLGAMMV